MRRIEVVISNWEDLWIISKREDRLSFFGMINFTLRLLALRMVARKVVYVRHDRFPHQTDATHASLAERYLNAVERLVSVAVTHSPNEATTRRRYVPHPLYHNPIVDIRQSTTTDAASYFIIFGRLLPYKNIDALVPAFPENERLLVIGPCDDDGYLRKLRKLCRGRLNIEIRAQYVDESTANRLVRNAKAMLLTSAGTDMVVSGSYFFALSNATPVIAMESDFYRWSLYTNRAPGLMICETLDEMTRSIATFKPPNRHAIAEYAIANFGDEAVRRSWDSVLKQ